MTSVSRIDTFVNTLREASEAGLPATYTSDLVTDKLITLTGNVSDLCWEIAVGAKQADPATKIIMADSIKYNATSIINICIAELANLNHSSETAIELIATDGALWFWSINQHPLDKLDQDTPADERIQSLYIATGILTEWWPNKISPQINIEPNSELEQAFVDLAYEATCAIIAHNHITKN